MISPAVRAYAKDTIAMLRENYLDEVGLAKTRKTAVTIMAENKIDDEAMYLQSTAVVILCDEIERLREIIDSCDHGCCAWNNDWFTPHRPTREPVK